MAWLKRATRLPSRAERFTFFLKCPAAVQETHSSRVRLRTSCLIIPGNVFSGRDTHFRISYAASEATIERGLAVLRKLV